MSTKGKFNLKGIKSGLQRTKQKVMTKFGRSEKTVDIQFDQEVERFKGALKSMEHTQKHCKDFLKSLRGLCIAENALAEDMSSSFDTSSTVYDAGIKNQSIIAELDHARTQLDETMREDFLEPFSTYLGQYGSIKARIDERNRRLVDMDRYKHDYQKHSEKGDAGKAQTAKQKYAGMKKAYTLLNAELLKDIPNLLKDKQVFLAPLFATLVQSQINYYSAAANILNGVSPMIRHIDRASAHSHPSVITPEESSTYKMDIEAAGAGADVSIDDEPVAHSHPPASAPPGHAGPAHHSTPAAGVPRRAPAPPMAAATKKCQALYPFTGQDASELSFAPGDIIVLLKCDAGQEWWQGELHGRTGLLPANYVKML